MEIIEAIDATITICSVGAIIWFVVAPSQREMGALIIAILYIAGAPFDVLFGRNASFWISMLLAFMHLYLYREERKDRLAREKKMLGEEDND